MTLPYLKYWGQGLQIGAPPITQSGWKSRHDGNRPLMPLTKGSDDIFFVSTLYYVDICSVHPHYQYRYVYTYLNYRQKQLFRGCTWSPASTCRYIAPLTTQIDDITVKPPKVMFNDLSGKQCRFVDKTVDNMWKMYGPTRDRTPNLRLFSKAH
jgi:hypothetical protein